MEASVSTDGARAAAAGEDPLSAFAVAAAEDDEDVEYNGSRAHAPPPPQQHAPPPHAEAPAERAARRLLRLRLAAGAAALALDAANLPPQQRAQLQDMLEQAERLVEREAAAQSKEQ